jgi:hypothetical protein
MGDAEFDFQLSNSTSTINWAQYSFVATAGFNVSTLRFFTILDGDETYAFIDDVCVTAVPEPATMAALAIGAVAAIRRRRTK